MVDKVAVMYPTGARISVHRVVKMLYSCVR
jgi:hypothetical protein